MAEWMVRKLSYSARWRELCGMSRDLLDADPALQREIILRAEHTVYGDSGLDAFEAAEPSPLRSLARRSLAQHFCQQELRGGRFPVLRRMVFGFAFFPLLALFVLATWGLRKLPATPGRP